MRNDTKSWSLQLYRLRTLLTSPVDAIPLDLFRIACGVLLFFYFFRTFLEARDLSNPDGIIDHQLIFEIFWFSKLGFFQNWMDLWVFQAVFLFACVLAIFLTIGYRVKLSSAILYIIAISTYRWNFIVMYVDDVIMHLLIFWMLVLPVGRTLTINGWMRNGRDAWETWKNVRVSGFALRCLFWNLALLYVVAGLWKWTSPMWVDGSALYVVFKLPISFASEFWQPEHIPYLKIFNYGTLILEPLIPLMFVLRKGHYLKYLLLFAFLGLHIGSVAMLDIPFANIACTVMPLLIFHRELMDWIRGISADNRTTESNFRIKLSDAFAFVMVLTLTLAMVSSVTLPAWRTPAREDNLIFARDNGYSAYQSEENPIPETRFVEDKPEGLGPIQATFFGILWCMGIAQQYQLFNWIDDRNYNVRYQISELLDGEVRSIEPELMFLQSTRGVLLQFYIHGITWARIPRERREELRNSILTRTANRFCGNNGPSGDISVRTTLERISADEIFVVKDNILLMKFRCIGSTAVIETIASDP